jgi:hypothetical protein
MKSASIFLDGNEFISKDTLSILSPVDNLPVFSLPALKKTDLDLIYNRSHAAFAK